jgi:hypothetical protein
MKTEMKQTLCGVGFVAVFAMQGSARGGPQFADALDGRNFDSAHSVFANTPEPDPRPIPMENEGSTLKANEQLLPNDFLQSPLGFYTLSMLATGDLVLTPDRTAADHRVALPYGRQRRCNLHHAG